MAGTGVEPAEGVRDDPGTSSVELPGPEGSVTPQRDRRVHPRGAPRRDPCGEQPGGAERLQALMLELVFFAPPDLAQVVVSLPGHRLLVSTTWVAAVLGTWVVHA